MSCSGLLSKLAALKGGLPHWPLCGLVGLLKRPERLAAPLQHAAKVFDFLGSALGGMVIRVNGDDAPGRLTQREWHISADDGHGPEIP